jgi:hypothetical protein
MEFEGFVPARLQISSPFHGFQHRHFVSIFQVRAHWNPDSDP